MIYALLAFVIVMFIFVYWFQKNFMAPMSLFLGSFLLSLGLIALNVDNWDVTISDRFTIYILTAILFFGVGCFLAEFLSDAFGKSNVWAVIIDKYSLQKETGIIAERYPAFILAFFSVFCAIGYILFMISSVEFNSDIPVLLARIYTSFTQGGSHSIGSTQLKEIVVAIAKITIFEILLERYLKKSQSSKFMLAIPVACFICCAIVSTDRNIFLRGVLYIMCLWVFFETAKEKLCIHAVNIKILKRLMICVLVTACAFFGIGKMKNATSSFDRMISIYGGSGLYNFNLYVENYPDKNLQFGADTFSEFSKTLKTVFLNERSFEMPFDEFIQFTSTSGVWYSSNVYSAFRPYIHDFGYGGMITYPFVLGILFEALYIQTKRYKYGIWWILYSLSMYSLVYTSILEQFFKRWHLGIVYEIGWVVLLYYFIYVFKFHNVLQVKDALTKKEQSASQEKIRSLV